MNFLMTFIGWFGWNVFEFSQAKDIYDERNEPFNFKDYAYKKFDNWLWTLVVASALYIIGIRGLGMDLVEHFDKDMKWSDLYYFASGFVSEVFAYAYRRWVKKQKTV